VTRCRQPQRATNAVQAAENKHHERNCIFFLQQFYLKMEAAMNCSGMEISYRTVATEHYINEKINEKT